ncbi:MULTISPECIES: CynX/NimT family MFS transporter [unclassified Candidatus Sulfotelmatobacter]|uniref:CynX/NimT family MFS transporter n=1 Tax=unclassified Candidatus Sulfotelmatobacter TaxID=2635724 RepID=UPI001CC232E5|nr:MULTISPECIES: MFS transporter [unclassified Candidatus Sulfotelmatobacter]
MAYYRSRDTTIQDVLAQFLRATGPAAAPHHPRSSVFVSTGSVPAVTPEGPGAASSLPVDPAATTPAPETPAPVVPSRGRGPRTPADRPLLLAAGLLLIAFNLRVGVAAVGPVIAEIRADMGFSGTVTSLLTAIPVFAFGVFAFLTPGLQKRWGMHRLLGMTMFVMAAGIALRLEVHAVALFGGTVLVGMTIAIGNVVMPTIIKQDFAHRAGLMMGLYSTALFVGAAAASGVTAPVAAATGSWRLALATGALPALAAFLLWLPQLRWSSGRQPVREAVAEVLERREPTFRRLMKDRLAWGVTLFMGFQSMSYYTAITWIPTILRDSGMDEHTAGWLLSFSQFPAIATALLAPMLAQRLRRAGLAVVLTVLVTAGGFLGLLLAPVQGAYVWMTLIGLGQGASISLGLSFIVWRSPDVHHTGHLSTMAQGWGYVIAGLGPLGIGALHSLTDGWEVPILVFGIVLVLQLVTGLVAGRDGHVLAGRV